MKNFKKSLACVLAIAMFLTAAPLAGFVGLALPARPSLPELNLPTVDLGGIFGFAANALNAAAATEEPVAEVVFVEEVATQMEPATAPAPTDVTAPEFVTDATDLDDCTDVTDCTDVVSTTNRPSVDVPPTETPGTDTPSTDTPSTSDITYNLDENGVLTISGEGTVSSFYAYNTAVKKIIVEDGITSIGSSAFRGCTALTEISIPSGVKSIVYYAFRDCTSLQTVTFGENSQLESIGTSAFDGCTALTEISIPSGVTRIDSDAFSGCTSLQTVTFGENSQLECIGSYAFYGCTALTEISIPSGVTSIGSYAFYGCTALTDILVHKDNTAYSSSDGVLYNKEQTILICCPAGKKSVTVADSVTSIVDFAFSGCTSLQTVTFGENSQLESIGTSAFDGCTALTEISIPFGVKSIVYSAFRDCTSLQTVTFGENSQLESIGSGAFDGCTALIEISIPSGVTRIDSSAFRGCTSLQTVTFGENSQLESIGFDAFYGCTALTEISIPSGVTRIDTYAFRGCTALTDILVHKDNTAYSSSDGVLYNKEQTTLICCPAGKKSVTVPDSVTSIGFGAFNICTSLQTVTFGENSQPESIGDSAFSGCTALTEISIPSGVTRIGDFAFDGCTSLQTVTFGENSQLESIGYYAFYGCSVLKAMNIPDTVTQIGQSAFDDCVSLTEIKLPDNLNELVYGVLRGCVSLKSVSVPRNVKSINSTALRGCTSLTTIEVDEGNEFFSASDSVLYDKEQTILMFYSHGKTEKSFAVPDSVTSIGDSAFSGCTALTEISIPSGVKSIDYSAFRGCQSLYHLYIPGSVTSIGNNAFLLCPGLVIRGYEDSYASIYAANNNIPFLAIDTTPYVTLAGGSVTPTAQFTVYGLATPMQTVSLYYGDTVIGTAAERANGRYSMTATLPEPEEGKTYSVVAKITVDGVEYASEPLAITYKSETATLNTLSFTHGRGSYTITPETMNQAAPVIAIDPNSKMSFVILLNGKNPESLTVVSTKNGVRKVIDATYNDIDGKWYASGWFYENDRSQTPGTITLEYDGEKIIEVPFNVLFIIDPSGYVYEAVKSNVLEGVTATVHYKDTNGKAVFWDADPFNQLNPQSTKADGYFCWNVPEGEWQVKFVKSGYQTAYSDWYEVPPEVTGLYIPMVSTENPRVEYCNVYEDYAEIRFTQYMQIDSVADTVSFADMNGTWEPVDKEVSGTDENVYYATTFKFTPATEFSGDVTVEMENTLNYAGTKLYYYSETFTVTEPVESFTLSAAELSVEVGAEGAVELNAGAAAAGYTAVVTVENTAVADAKQSIVLNENGKATLSVSGIGFGTTVLRVELVGTPLSAELAVTASVPKTIAKRYTMGDVDGDGDIKAADARLALRASVKLEVLSESQFTAADADFDGAINASDARSILRASVKLEDPSDWKKKA